MRSAKAGRGGEGSNVRVLSIVLGILLVVGGVMSIVNPGLAALGLGSLMGLFILVHGVGSLINHYRFRSLGESWGIAGAILSILLGVLLMTNGALQWATNLAIVFIAGLWLLVAGIVCMVTAIKVARARALIAWERPTLGWLWLLFLGLLLILMGILAYVQPVVGVMTIGTLLGLYVIASGVELIAVSCCRPVY